MHNGCSLLAMRMACKVCFGTKETSYTYAALLCHCK